MRADEKRLGEIDARVKALDSAPDAPWGVTRVEDQWGVFHNPEDPAMRELVLFVPPARLGYSVPTDRDLALFCAHAREDVPDLAADLREERQKVAGYKHDCERYRARIAELEEETQRLKALLNRDQTGLAAGLGAVQKVVGSYAWLPLGEWGSYSYEEHTQETLRKEIGWAFDAISEIATRHLEQSGLRADAAFKGGPGPVESVDLGNMVRVASGHADEVGVATEEFARKVEALGREFKRRLAALAKGKTGAAAGQGSEE